MFPHSNVAQPVSPTETRALAQSYAYEMLTRTAFDLTPYLKPTGGHGGDLYMTARSLVTLVSQLLEIINDLGGDEGMMPLRLTSDGGYWAIPFDADRETISRLVALIRRHHIE